MSLLRIANLLSQKGIEYLPAQVNWNKGKIKRMIEDKRYLGDEKYPQIINIDLYNQANRTKEIRNTTQNINRSDYIYKLKLPVICSECNGNMKRIHDTQLKVKEKWVCTECGHSEKICDTVFLSMMTDALNYLIKNPNVIKSESQSSTSNETVKTENEINRMLEISNIDKTILKKKIFDLASLKYTDLDAGSYISEQIKKEFENAELISEISLPLLMKTTSAIIINSDTDLSLVLKNNQIIGKEKSYGTENSQIHSTDNNSTIKCEKFVPTGKSCSILPCINKAG